MTLTRNMLLVASGVLAISLSGCGRSASTSAGGASPSATPATGIPNACDVLTEVIAKKYLGAGAQLRRKAQPNPRMTQCQWGSDRGVITVMVGPWDMIHTGSMADKPQTGLGDEAYSGAGGIDVRKGDRGINIDMIVEAGEFWGKAADDEEAKTLAAENKVAPDLVARL
ncbi:MAG TPA: hypothetical protein VKQ70_10900 [Caulobacteraceae bacterium]|jgi:hypothetical protein|nr:hypothetical protein [Caulobacteraceae bacterium]